MKHEKQTGAALVIVLMLLLVITVLGLASMRGSLMQERMAGAAYARSITFNAAEAALRVGEGVAATKPALPPTGCVAGICNRSDPAVTPVWKDADTWTGGAAASVPLGSGYKGVTARYIVEHVGYASSSCVQMGDIACPLDATIYRITARAVSPNGAEVLLQTTYQVQ